MNGTTLAAGIAEGMGLLMIGCMVWIMWRSHHNKEFDLGFLLVDSQLGQVTLAKFGGLLALLASTWIVVYEAVDKSLTDITFAAYVGAWVAGKVATDYVNLSSKKMDTENPPPPGTTQTTSTVQETLTVAPIAATQKRKRK